MAVSRNRQAGFTLLEISIVLVVIGLIAGGIMASQYIIHSSRIRAQVSDLSRFSAAVTTFTTSYGVVPGDLKPGTAARLNFMPIPLIDGGTKGCGDENGRIEGGTYYDGLTYNCNGDNMNEVVMLWMHLSQADLLHSNYDKTDITFELEKKRTVPAMRIGTGFVVASRGLSDPAMHYHLVDFNVGLAGYKTLLSAPKPSLSALEAFELDQKLDDSHPNSGTVRASNPQTSGTSNGISSAPEATGDCLSSGEYNLDSKTSNATGSCGLSVKM